MKVTMKLFLWGIANILATLILWLIDFAFSVLIVFVALLYIAYKAIKEVL